MNRSGNALKSPIPAALALLFCLVLSTPAQATTEIWFMRHAETIGDATKDYSGENNNRLSNEGLHQARLLAHEMDKMHFDTVLVSPMPAASLTIKPWLKNHHTNVETWPELSECCWQKNQRSRSYREGIAMINNAVKKIRSRFAGRHQKVLIIGHYHAGSRLAEALQRYNPIGRYELRNTGMMHLIEISNGRFQIIDSN